ncbi:hypothetical protein MMC22_000376 [Lobaria immixta]|nr:hypothetical protein [Lobaria immixta]
MPGYADHRTPWQFELANVQPPGISLAPNALRVLDQLGLDEDIAANGQKLDTILIHRNTTKWRALDFTCVDSTFGYPVYSIERHHFHRELYTAAGGEETVLLGSKVEDLLDDPCSSFGTVKLANGAEITADVVVGADGIRSVTLRILARNAGLPAVNSINFTGRVHMSGYTSPVKHLGPSELGVGNWLLDNRQWFIGVKRAELHQDNQIDRSVWAHTTPSMVKDAYGDNFHPFTKSRKFEDIVDQSERVIASNVFEEQDFPSMAEGRVALLGDAAHSMTSFFGQGACQAIEDATELANALQSCFSEQDQQAKTIKECDEVGRMARPEPLTIQQTLRKYSAKREQRAKALVSFSSNYAKVHTANLLYGLGPMVRKLIYAYLPEWGWMWGLKWLYGYQPTVEHMPVVARS